MGYTSLLRFGLHVHIEMTRDANRHICRLCTLIRNKEEGYLLETNSNNQSGTLFIMPSRQIHERYEEGVILSPRHGTKESNKVEYESWVKSCIQQATAWARSHAIQAANTSISRGEFEEASETYHDVIDHFPPPPDGPLLHWNYYRCIAHMQGLEEAQEGLMLWLEEALPIAGINVNSAVLDPAKELLGIDIARQAAEMWLISSSPHDPAHKMAKRWLDRQGQDGVGGLRWTFENNNPLQTNNSLLIPLQNGNIMAVGGRELDGKLSSKAGIWNGQNRSWTVISDVPCGIVEHMGIAIDQSTVMILGGQSNHDDYSRRVFLWNYATDTWLEKAPLNHGRKSCGLVLHNGRVVVLGGEDPLSSDTTMEIWDRRKETWTEITSIALCVPEISLMSFGHQIIATGPSLSSSGFGAIIWNTSTQTWVYPEETRGIGFDGMCRLNDCEIVVWSKKSGGIDIGIWSMGTNSIHWNCKDVELSTRNDLSVVAQHEDTHFVLLYANQDLFTQAQLINPTTGNLSELPGLCDQNIPMEHISVCSILRGVFLLSASGWAVL